MFTSVKTKLSLPLQKILASEVRGNELCAYLEGNTNYKVYKLSNVHHIWDAIKMQETGYNIKNGGENNKYYIYNLLDEVSEDVLGEFDIKSILEHERKEINFATNQSLAKGAPVYIYESDLKIVGFSKKMTLF